MTSVYRDEYYSSDGYRERLERLATAIKERDARRAMAMRVRQSERERLEKIHPTLRPWRKGDPVVQLKPVNPVEGCEEYRPIPKLDNPDLRDVRTTQKEGDSKGASSFVGVVFTGRRTPRRVGSDDAFGTSGNAFTKNPFATDKRPRALRFE